MKEDFLAFLWQYHYASSHALFTVQGEAISVLHPGFRNTNSGPDFLQSNLKINHTQWVGNVELHIKSGDWYKHKHHQDKMYDSVILHVVWEHDKTVCLNSGEELPTIELKSFIDKNLLYKYQELMESKTRLLCSNLLPTVPNLMKTTMLNRSLVERLEYKMGELDTLFLKSNKDWQEMAYQVLLGAFGFSLNKDPFIELAANLPYKHLAKHLDSAEQVLALLFGFSNVAKEEKIRAVYEQEYRFLLYKFKLSHKQIEPHQWKYFRVRPGGFPSVRMYQLARLLINAKGLRAVFFENCSVKKIGNLVNGSISHQWKQAFATLELKMSTTTIELLLINAILPFQFYYGKRTSNETLTNQVLQAYEQLKPEKNSILNLAASAGFGFENAGETQATLHLIKNYCDKKRCLQCMIGTYIIKKQGKSR